MTVDELGNRYMSLRTELAHAYEAPVWDSLRIDGLTDAIAATETALAASGASQAYTPPSPRRLHSAVAAAPL